MNQNSLQSILDLYNFKIIKILIKNNCIIYGNVIRNALHNKVNNTYLINAIAPIIYKEIIERDLYGIIKSKIFTNSNDYKRELYSYECIFNKKKYLLDICYVSEINLHKIQILKKTILLDIDLLSINRFGLSLIYNLTINDIEIPIPFQNILQSINKKEFTIIGKIENEFDISYISEFLNLGWKNNSSTIHFKKGSLYLTNKCTICMENIKSNDKICELKCKHYFHKSCWSENIKQLTKDIKEIKCPICRKKYNIKEVIC